MSIVTWILIWPLAAAAAIAAIPRNYRFAIRLTALGATLISMALALVMFARFDAYRAGYQFESNVAWAPSIGIRFHVGVDGLNVGLLLMGAVVAFAAAAAAWEIREREKLFYFLLMTMTFGVLGAFAALDLFFFFFFHELALIPTFIMIGVWGRGPNRNFATFQITLYLSLGALAALVGLLALYFKAGAGSFDIPTIAEHLRAHPMAAGAQHFIFPFLLFGFGVLVSLWPFHSWAPLGYSSAPSPTAMLHAGVLKKFGVYGLIRIALPFLPGAARAWMPLVAALCLGNIIYVGWVAMRQRDLNLLFGNSSVAHMGFVFLGIASLTVTGVTGAVVVMVAHGFLAALCFGLSGFLYQRAGTLEMSQFSGLLRKMPFIGTAMIFAMFAGCGLPGFANFVGELMVFFGAWNPLRFVTGVAVWGGSVIGAVYMLRAIRNIWHGPLLDSEQTLEDAVGPWRKLPFTLLLAGLIAFGCAPRLLVDRVKGSVEDVVRIVAATAPSPAANHESAAIAQAAGGRP